MIVPHQLFAQRNIEFSASKNLTTNNISKFFLIYFDFAYFLLLSPFRFIKSQKARPDQLDQIKIKSNWIQQALVLLLNSLGSLRLVRDIYLTSRISTDVNDSFRLFTILSRLMFNILVFKLLWFSQTKILKIIELLSIQESCGRLPYIMNKVCSTRFVSKLMTAFNFKNFCYFNRLEVGDLRK